MAENGNVMQRAMLLGVGHAISSWCQSERDKAISCVLEGWNRETGGNAI